MEAHEDFLVGIGVALELLALDALFIHVARNGVVDVEQSDSILSDAGADELRQSAIDIYFASHSNAATRQTAVHIARNEAEHGLESWPALVCHSYELTAALVTFDPVEQGQLILSKSWQHGWNLVASTQFLDHILHHVVDAWVTSVLLESFEQVKLGVLLNLHVEIIEGADRSVTSEEVVRTRTEADDLQVLQTYDSTCDGQELVNHFSTLGSVANRLFRDVSTGLAQRECLAGVQHTAVSVATTVDEVVLSFLSSSTEHCRALEPVGNHGLRNLRTEVAQIDAECVTASLLNIS